MSLNSIKEPIAHLNYLKKQISNTLRTDHFINEGYWKCFCCFCPKVNNSQIISVNRKTIAINQILQIFQNSIQSHAFKNSPLGTAINGPNGNLFDCNEAYLKLLGYAKKELLGKPYDRLVDPADHNIAKKHQYELDNGTTIEQFEARAIHKNGRKIWTQVTVSTIHDDDQNVICYLTQLQDISHLKNQQILLEKAVHKKTKELQDAFQHISDSSDISAHDIRTGLNGVIWTAKLLIQKEIEVENIEEAYVDILNTANHLLELVNDKLDFSKLNQKQFKFKRQIFSLKKLIRDIIKLHSMQIKNKDIFLEFTIGKNIPIEVWGDKKQIRRILENFLSNAIKYTLSGKILISIENITPDIQKNTPEIEGFSELILKFTVNDSGTGIAPEDLDRIFQPFQQGFDAQTGTGLGLPIAKALIEAMGGEILSVKSSYGKKNSGSSFSFTLKLQQANSSPPIKHKRLSIKNRSSSSNSPRENINPILIQLQGKKVLAVDDNQLNLKLLIKILKIANMTIVSATNGLEAVNILKNDLKATQQTGKSKSTFDIVLMDMEMPVLNGTSATEQIRNILHLQIPIIALTANHSTADRQRYINSGVDHISHKPYNSQKLYKTMNQLITKYSSKLPVSQFSIRKVLTHTPSKRFITRLSEHKEDLPNQVLSTF